MKFGVVNKMVALLMPFVTRTIIKMVLGSEYLGLNSLFSSILTVLSLSELGIGGAIVYNMYRPVAENDTETVCPLLNFYRKLYPVIGTVILVLGLLLIPVLPNLISGSYPENMSLTVLYLMFLANTVISYFMYAYMSSLLVVYQRDDVNSRTNTLVSLLMNGTEIILLLTTKNYYFYVLMMPLFTIVNNLRIAFIVRRMYPQYKPAGSISKEMRDDIRVRVSGAFISNVCKATRNSLDSICISYYLGLTLTAMYNNYYYVISGLISLLHIVSTALQGGIGNHVVTRSVDENFNELKKADFLYMWISAWCTVCLICIYQPFMRLWMGEDMMFPFSVAVLISLYFYLLKMGDMKSIYATTNGLWWNMRYRSLAEAAGNIILNIVLGKFFGVYGIVIATMITIFVCNFLWGSQIIFKNYFGADKIPAYFRYHFKYMATMILMCAVTYGLCSLLPIENLQGVLAARAAICIVVPNLIWILLYHGTGEFSFALSLLKKR